MLWVGGRVVPDDALRVSVLDRTFEHGLGLFETLRTWNGRAPLLDRHLARLSRSARELRLPLDPAALPDASAVTTLLDANGPAGDVLLRVTLSGGLGASGGATLWMRAAPLPSPWREGGARAVLDSSAASEHRLARHKTLNYWARREAFEAARSRGFDEALLAGHRGAGGLTVWEGSRTNLFAVRGGVLRTAATSGPIVPGVMRGLVLERARGLALTAVEEPGGLSVSTLAEAEEVFLTNSVRGVIPLAGVAGTEALTWPAPGRWTTALSDDINGVLERGGSLT